MAGITGQKGSYLGESLVAKRYEVQGIVRGVAIEDPGRRLSRLSAVLDRIKLQAASIESYASVYQVVAEIVPHECCHLAAQSFVSYSFDDEFSSFNVNINGTHFLLEALRTVAPHCRFYFAGTSEITNRRDADTKDHFRHCPDRGRLGHAAPTRQPRRQAIGATPANMWKRCG